MKVNRTGCVDGNGLQVGRDGDAGERKDNGKKEKLNKAKGYQSYSSSGEFLL